MCISENKVIFLDKYIDLNAVQVTSYGPTTFIRPINESAAALDDVYTKLKNSGEKMGVYKKEVSTHFWTKKVFLIQNRKFLQISLFRTTCGSRPSCWWLRTGGLSATLILSVSTVTGLQEVTTATATHRPTWGFFFFLNFVTWKCCTQSRGFVTCLKFSSLKLTFVTP